MNFRHIRKQYFRNGAVEDLVIWFPIQTLLCFTAPDSNADVLFWIKVYRVILLNEFFPKHLSKKVIYKRQMEYNESQAKKDFQFRENVYRDHTAINLATVVTYVYQMLSLVISIVNITFLLSMLFATFVRVTDGGH